MGIATQMSISATCAREVIEAARARIVELNLSYESVDELAGFTTRYVSKIMSGKRTLTLPTMFALLGALALEPVLTPNARRVAVLQGFSAWKAVQRRGRQYRPRAMRNDVPHPVKKIEFSPDYMRFLATLGHKSPKWTKAKRRRQARQAAVARWARRERIQEVGK